MTYDLRFGDCLDILPTLPAQSVDAIIADPPYGTTACKWDSVIPLDTMWRELKRVIKPNGAVVLFGAQPFTSVLVTSNLQWFKYELVWDKRRLTGFLDAKRKPLRKHENIMMFANGVHTYNPQMGTGTPYKHNGKRGPGGQSITKDTGALLAIMPIDNYGNRYPTSIVETVSERGLHPTQKPVDLMRYLVRTYTNAGETVLDFTAGSGSTGVAALLEGRKFIGIEKDAGYYAIMERRCVETIAQPSLLGVAA